MSKKMGLLIVITIAVIGGIALYRVAWHRHVSRMHTESQTAPNVHETAGPAKTAGTTARAMRPQYQVPNRLRYSGREYEYLRHRFRTRTPEAYGPAPASQLALMAKLTKYALVSGDMKFLPAVKDVIFGKAAALEDKLDTGLSANTAVTLGPPNNVKKSLLVLAIQAGQRSAIRILLAHDAHVNVSDSTLSGTPLSQDDQPGVGVEAPLAEAAALGEGDVTMQLLEHGANPNSVSVIRRPGGVLKFSALQRAVSGIHIATAYLLLSHGANVNSAFGGDAPWMAVDDPGAPPSPSILAMKKLLTRYGYNFPK